MVVKRYRGSSAEAAWRVRLPIDPPFALDVLVRSPVEIRRRLGLGDDFISELTAKGIVLHEDGDERVGRQGRRRLRRRLHPAAVAQAEYVGWVLPTSATTVNG
jgi:hypothetical protein